MGLKKWLTGSAEIQRQGDPLPFNAWLGYFNYLNNRYAYGLNQTMPGFKQEEFSADFAGAQRMYKSNPVVFACMRTRMSVFSEARFMFREIVDGRPGDLQGTRALLPLQTPWPGGTSGDLLSRMIQDVDLSGNSFWIRDANRLYRLRPDWVTVVGGGTDPDASDVELVGYVYHPGGRNSGRDPERFLPEQVAHFMPIPDPAFRFRGMSWITPIILEVMADSAATTHKLNFFENGATPNLVVKLDIGNKEQFEDWVKMFESKHTGASNAYKTLFLGAGADAQVVGTNLEQLDFKITQGAGETRIAAAAGVPPVIVGLSEGLQAATYSNYGQARRHFADATCRPLWRNVCGSLAKLVNPPAGTELWYDAEDISFLQEDQKDAAAIRQIDALTIKALTDSGFEPKAVVEAVTSGDLKRLTNKHTGLFSVQLQPPGTETPAEPSPNGKVPVGALEGQ